jgi:REP element-mobilizing transposase RayT
MPSRNTIRQNAPDSYYHVYARRASKEPLFIDPSDYEFFISLFERHLSKKVVLDSSNIAYKKYIGDIELLAYCLMGNHFHLLVYQTNQDALEKLMRSVMTAYSRRFNLKYNRTGSLFESRYKASKIETQSYLEHISRYIHLNPRYWLRYKYSSVPYYISDISAPDWISTSKIKELYSSPEDYKTFLYDYEACKQMLDEIKYELADR